MNNRYKKTVLWLVVALLGTTWSLYGQVTVTNPSNTTPAMSATYTSLALAIADVNNRTGISGPVTITLSANQTAPAGGYSITNTAITGSSNANRFIFDGGGNTITAGVGSTTTTDAFFKIIGADFITIQNFVMNESAGNTTATTQIEWGIALLYSSTTNGAQNCIIQNNTITLNRTNPNSIGIYCNSTHSATAVGTSATATTTAGSNSGLKIYSNTISNVNQGIIVVGPTAIADANTGVDIGGNSSTTGNIINNYGTTTTSSYTNVSGTVNGILVRNSNGFNVSYNTITSSNGGVTVGTLNGIQIQAATNAPTATFTNTITYNIISLQSGLATGAINGITYPSGSASATSIVNITNNDFTRLNHSVTASGAIVAISKASTDLTTNINNNTFTNLTCNTTGSFTFISHSYSIPAGGATNINNNAIVTAFNKTGAGGTVTLTTTNGSSPSGTTATYTNNNFSNITVTGGTGITGFNNTDGGTASAKTITGNTFNNWVGGTSSITGMNFTCFSGTSTLSSNTLTNITGQGAITGISIGSTANGTLLTVASNIINNLSSTGTGGQVRAISCSNTSTTININGNAINTLSSSGASSAVVGILITGAATTNVFSNTIYGVVASGTTSPLALGISVQGGTTVNTYSNKIYNINATGAISTTSPAVIGLNITLGTTVNSYNNLIGDLTAPSASLTNAIRGISIGSTTANTSYNIYNNTVYLTGSGGANFGTSGIYHTANTIASTAKLDLQNNMVFNNCTPSGTGLVVAYTRSDGGGSMLANYASTSNKNLFYAGTPSASNLIYSDGTSSAQTMAAYQAGVFAAGTIASRDANSFTETSFNPATFFVSTTGSNANYLQPASGLTTQAEGGGNTITMCSPDYNGVIRPGFSGAAYDVGAWEFVGVSPAPVLTSMSPSPALTAQCTKVDRLISIDIITSSGTITGATLNYSHNGVAQTAVTMTNSSGNTWIGTMLAPSTGNATVTWSITATNSLGLSTLYNGTSYADEPNTGVTATATATPSTVCAGSPTNLQLVLSSNSISAPTGYTTSNLGGSTSPYISLLTLNTLSYSSSTSPVSPFYKSMPFSGTSTTSLTLGQTLTATVNTASAAIVSIWVDFNRNGSFETSEWFQPYTNASSGTVSIIVPSDASAGQTRMRIRTRATSSPNGSGDANTNFATGETIDFTITLIPNPTSFSWSDGSTTVGTTNPLSVSPTSATTYTCTATVNGCPMTASVTPTVNPLPIAPTATNSSQCGAGTPSASVADNNGYTTPTFKWYSAASGGAAIQTSTSTTYTTSINTTTTFYVAVVNPTTGCESSRIAVTVTINPIPSALTLSPSTTTGVCGGSVQTVSLTSGGVIPHLNMILLPATSAISGTGLVFRTSVSSNTTQAIYSVSELLAMGLKAGDNIAAISYETTVAGNPVNLASLVISTAWVTDSFFTNPSFVTGLTIQSTNLNVPTSPGVKKFSLSVPPVWDGSSHLLVQAVTTTTPPHGTSATERALPAKTHSTISSTSTAPASIRSSQRPYIILDFNSVQPITWSPTTDLYTNLAATSAYTGTAATTLYAQLTANRTYTATATVASTGCTNTKSVQLNNNIPANNVVLASNSQTSAVQQCTDVTGWTYYATAANPDQWIFAINKGATGMTGETISVEVLGSNPSSTSSAGINQQHGSYLMKRGWDVTGTVPTGSVSVRFFYDPADTTSVNTDRDAGFAALSAGSLAVKTGFEWFKSTGTPYNASWRALVVGNKFPSSHVKLIPTFGSINGVNYVEFSGITSFSGGSGGSGFGPPSSGGGVGLPVTWAGFDAVAKESGNDLTWKTASEVNTSHFEVEYSYDGINYNKSAIKVPAAGSSQTIQTYNYTHKDVSTFVYYRIKQVDMDSRFDYSATKLVKRTDAKTFQVSVYPIPVLDDQVLNVEVKAIDKSDLFITILDMNGRIVKSRTTKPTTNSILVEKINVSNLSNGLYQVVIQNGQGKEVVKFSK
jgi:hypothetical protein